VKTRCQYDSVAIFVVVRHARAIPL